jgi:hypothetical protein
LWITRRINMSLSRRPMLLFLFLFQLLLSISNVKSGSVTNTGCPSRCSGHGLCSTDGSNSGICQCYSGFIGIDCSLRLCPSHTAWVDYPTANNTAHAAFTECSNMVSSSFSLFSHSLSLSFLSSPPSSFFPCHLT